MNRLWISEEIVNKERKGKRILPFLVTLSLLLIFAALILENTNNNQIEQTENPPEPTPITAPEEPHEEEPIRYPLSDEERSIVERVVMAEAGNQSPLGQMAVAQCILNTAEATGQRPDAVVFAPNQYAAPASYATDDVKSAVASVFDGGVKAVDEPIRYFYAPKASSGRWHESALEYVATFGDHKFFKLKGE